MNKKFHVFLLMSILIAAAAIPLAAQSVNVKATIPFEFVVSGQTMPAGDYAVGTAIAPGILTIGSKDGSAVARAFAIPVDTRDGYPPEESRLVFRQYGSQYFLSQIWSAASSVGQELPQSRAEREVAKTASVRPQTVLVLAQGRSRGDILAR